MDDYNYNSYDAGYSYAPTVVDHYAESYNYGTTDSIAIMIRHQREDDERRLYEAEPVQEWTSTAPSISAYSSEPMQEWSSTASSTKAYSPEPPTYNSRSNGGLSRKELAEYAASRADDPDAPHQALAAMVAGHKYYHLPGEPASWRRPLHGPGGKHDGQWWAMFHDADDRSMVLAELLGYIGARDADGWIRPTLWELLRMDFWTAQRYAFYYAEFADEYKRKVPRWIKLLRSVETRYTPSAVMFG
jgi:hypothetical protein